MKDIPRRAVLGSASGVLIAGAGCLSHSKPNAKICFISIKNQRPHAVNVHLRIKDGSQTVLHKTYHLETYSGTDAKASVEYLKRPVENSGRYHVTVTTDGNSASVDTTKLIQGKNDSVYMIFKITPDSGILDERDAVQHCS